VSPGKIFVLNRSKSLIGYVRSKNKNCAGLQKLPGTFYEHCKFSSLDVSSQVHNVSLVSRILQQKFILAI